MKFKRYGGLLSDWLLLNIASLIVLTASGLFLWLGMGGGWTALPIGLLAALALAVLSRLALLAKLRLGEGGSLSDMIVIDGEGIHLEQRGERTLSIAWGNISAVRKSRGPRRPTELRVFDSDGGELGWYPADRGSQNYILEQHPELAKLLNFDFR